MTLDWATVAHRIADALALQPGMLVAVQDASGRYELTETILLALEQRGATPLLEILPPHYLQRLLTTTDPRHLAAWDRHRADWLKQVDRILVLADTHANLDAIPIRARTAWQQARERLIQIEDERRIPFELVAIPTWTRARLLGMTLPKLDEAILPALAVSPDCLQIEIDRLVPHLRDTGQITIGSLDDAELTFDVTGRTWLVDSGTLMTDASAANVQPVNNLPAGSIYTTVVESSTEGCLVLPQAGEAREVVLTFEEGRIVSIEAAVGADALNALFDDHTGEPRRISHIGIGLNPALDREFGWVLVDEHRHGNLFIALGENGYLGGENRSSLNVDFVLPNGSLYADGQVIVEAGDVVG